MNTRRIPFQFSTTDPLARQKELEKRFGLQPTSPKMYVDVNNPLSMNTTKEISSPRLQHRVPIFVEGYNRPINSSSVDSMASVPDKKQNVRVIPIEVEGADNKSQRHRNYSGPAGMVKDRSSDLAPERNEAYPFKKFHFGDSSKSSSPKLSAEPRIYNIPIHVEGVNDKSKSSIADAIPKSKSVISSINGCSHSKSSNKVSSEKDVKEQQSESKNQTDQPKNNIEILLKKIEDILTEFKTYETEVSEFTGTSKDKQYRYLDEMLTRCMLKLDDIDTMGNEEVRLARKNAVKKIQTSIDLLESKASVNSSEIPEVQSVPLENNVDEMQNNKDEDNVVSVDETSEMKEMDITEGDQCNLLETSDKIANNANDSENKVEETEITSLVQNIIKDADETEMSEDQTNDLLKSSNKIGDVIQDEKNSSSNQHNSMTGEILTEVNSYQSPETLFSNENIEQSEASDNLTDDIDMMEENTMSNADKNLQNKIAQDESVNKSIEETEVEMIETEDISKDSGEKIKCETEVVDHNFDSSVQKASHTAIDLNAHSESVLPMDVEMKDLPSVLDTGDKCTTDQLAKQEMPLSTEAK